MQSPSHATGFNRRTNPIDNFNTKGIRCGKDGVVCNVDTFDTKFHCNTGIVRILWRAGYDFSHFGLLFHDHLFHLHSIYSRLLY